LIPEHWPTPSTLRYRKAVGVFDRIIYQLIEERRREKDHRHDLLTALLEAKQENGEPLSGKDIRDELVTMLLAGHETTANALSWTLYLLSQYPEAEERFHEEIDRIAQPCTFDDSVMSQLPYTAALFAESMRLFPPVWRIGRRALLPDQLPGGVKLPSGAEIVILISVLHRDPALFPEPDRFNPDRFLIPGPRSSFLPFGGGPRICIGEDFARNEAVIMLALIGSGFRLSLMNTRRVKPEPLIALRPREHIMMKLHSREKSITRQTHFFSRQFQETA
jgi:cytochrome P450